MCRSTCLDMLRISKISLSVHAFGPIPGSVVYGPDTTLQPLKQCHVHTSPVSFLPGTRGGLVLCLLCNSTTWTFYYISVCLSIQHVQSCMASDLRLVYCQRHCGLWMLGQTSDCFKGIAMLNWLKWYSYQIITISFFYLLIFKEMFDWTSATCVRYIKWEWGGEREERERERYEESKSDWCRWVIGLCDSHCTLSY